MPVLTGIDLLRIQEYIFSSNRLSDVLSASAMVDKVIDRENLMSQVKEFKGEILLAAGGNAMIVFPSLPEAKEWAAHFTRWILDTAVGLEVVIAHRCYEGNQPLALAMKVLYHHDLPRRKFDRIPTAEQQGMSVTASCAITGYPATARDPDNGDLLGRQLQSLRHKSHMRNAKRRWDTFLASITPDAGVQAATFPDELDDMGRSHGDTSLLGIVHIDGNGVGSRIQQWLDRCIHDELADDDVRSQCTEWSNQLRDLGDHLLRAIVQRVRQCIKPNERSEFELYGRPEDLGFYLKAENANSSRRVVLPLRPILLGGDDFTFVCDGRLALDLAATSLKTFENHHIHHLGENGVPLALSGCAGVAIVKSHAPFYRGYELAAGLCRQAKMERRRYIEDNPEAEDSTKGSWLDWHIGATRPGESVEQIRQRQYRNISGDHLTLRPYPLSSTSCLSWHHFHENLLGPGAAGNAGFRGMPSWLKSRNRVKALATIARDGWGAVEKQLRLWQMTDPDLEIPESMAYRQRKIWLLDAIELLDLHVNLDQVADAGEQA